MRGGARAGGTGGVRSAPMGAFRGAPVASVRGVPRGAVVTRSQVFVRPCCGNFGFGFGVGFHSHPFFPRNRFFTGYVYPYYPYAYAYPYGYYGYPYDSSYYNNDSDNEASYYAQQQLNAQIGSLTEQIQDLRAQNDSLRDYVARTNPAPTQGPDRSYPQSLQQPMQTENPGPATVLVFRDGHRAEVRNYAIVGKTLWALSENRSVKYPLADIDIEKTAQENEQRGVEFTAPANE